LPSSIRYIKGGQVCTVQDNSISYNLPTFLVGDNAEEICDNFAQYLQNIINENIYTPLSVQLNEINFLNS